MSSLIDHEARRVLRTTAQAWGLPTPLRVRGTAGRRSERARACPLRLGFLPGFAY